VVEQAVPASGQGAAKLDMLKNMLQQAYANFSTLTVTFEQVWPMLTPVITGLVAMYKATGVFVPQPPAQPTNTPPAA
jgi:hypothetical protein